MGRIRLVWTRIWKILSDFFVDAGCHENLNVSMYAIDSLRQLAMKFLEKDELANYQFQKQFLKPFEYIMANSRSSEIRELVVQCLSRMVLGRVNNVKSGWKSVFVVLTCGAKDPLAALVVSTFALVNHRNFIIPLPLFSGTISLAFQHNHR
jgi:brefeldin A-inhibited guanine nucleotide-exchange protein